MWKAAALAAAFSFYALREREKEKILLNWLHKGIGWCIIGVTAEPKAVKEEVWYM